MFEFGIKNIAFLIVFTAAAIFFVKNVSRLISWLKLGKADNRFDNIGARIKQTLIVAIAQKKILRDKKAGPIHAGIFWGFLILLFSAANSVLTGFGIINIFNYLGPIYSVITILTDVFIALIMLAVSGAIYRRYVLKIERLPKDKEEKIEAFAILLTIFFIVTSLLFENAAMIVMGTHPSWAVNPLASALSTIISTSAAPIIYNIGWWLHIILILAFMNFLPYSKHLHVLTSVLNVFFSNLGPTNKLEPIDFEDETAEKFGIVDIDDLSWKSIMDGYTCTHCGRCTSVCPANQTGKILDPREIIIQVRNRTEDVAPIMIKQKEAKAAGTEYQPSEEEQVILDKKLVGDYVKPEALWQCTTCSACMEECPVNIEHVPVIVGMRRSLVMMEADFPQELAGAFNNIENNAAPWAFPQEERANWAEGMDVQEAADKPDFDILFWVGCSGSFDDRSKKITQSFATLMNIADINFAILGKEESCNGDPARRGGNEYLADTFVKMNIETMGNYNVKKIVTTCPHCFNTLKNEYPDQGGNYEVIHHSEFLDQLIAEGKLPFNHDIKKELSVVMHDSCYLGRLNQNYDSPRNTIKSIPGLTVLEPQRNKDKGFCCGAGGARMFMEETEGKHINIERTEELLETGAKTIALNCPFCMTMITDGVASTGAENVKVKDISEILLEHIEANHKD
ncbi:MAG: heterodisulfide reductase-related iron-sulfur binding cluster [Candidatus Kapaibacterium sp.]